MLIIALVASLAVTMMPGTGRAGLKALALADRRVASSRASWRDADRARTRRVA